MRLLPGLTPSALFPGSSLHNIPYAKLSQENGTDKIKHPTQTGTRSVLGASASLRFLLSLGDDLNP
jgi:hypothetical protein